MTGTEFQSFSLMSEVKRESTAEYDIIQPSLTEHIDTRTAEYEASTSQPMDTRTGNYEASTSQHIDTRTGNYEVSTSQHIDTRTGNYEASVSQFIDTRTTEYEASTSQLIDTRTDDLPTKQDKNSANRCNFFTNIGNVTHNATENSTSEGEIGSTATYEQSASQDIDKGTGGFLNHISTHSSNTTINQQGIRACQESDISSHTSNTTITTAECTSSSHIANTVLLPAHGVVRPGLSGDFKTYKDVQVVMLADTTSQEGSPVSSAGSVRPEMVSTTHKRFPIYTTSNVPQLVSTTQEGLPVSAGTNAQEMVTSLGDFPVSTVTNIHYTATHKALPDSSAVNIREKVTAKVYQCECCQAKFLQKHHLTQHLKTHTGEKPYFCDKCSAVFSQKYSLNRHQLVHTGAKPYKCCQCSAVFTMKHGLMQHLLIHSGEKRYQCEHCSARFNRKFTLERHQKVHGNVSKKLCL